MPEDAGKPIRFRYFFEFQNGRRKEFEIFLDRGTLALIAEPRSEYPQWTQLEFHQCPNCPLKAPDHPRCPVAQNVVEPIEFFCNSLSIEEVDVIVEVEQRSYQKRVPLQTAVSAMMGILMCTSGCPILDRMRPMVDSHLPFPSPDEAAFRIISMYLVAQYFVAQQGGAPDWTMEKLVPFFAEIQKVNTAFCERLNAIKIKDASINAVVSLSALSSFTGLRLERGKLEHLQKIFSAAWPKPS